LFWTLPGQKQVSLTVTDANGCQIIHEQNIQVIDPNCALPPGIIQIEPAQLTCDIAQSDCPYSQQNGQIFVTPPPSPAGDCYVFYAEYSATDPNVNIPEDYYANSAFELLPDGRRRLGCLPGGYYKITMTDEVSTCFNTTTEHVPFETDSLPLVFISQHTANLAYGGMLNGFCGGTIQIDEINGEAFDSDDYVFTWSDCIDCNVPARQHLCIGTYTVTATNRYTGCSGQQTITLQLQCGEGTGEVVGVVDVYPTIYDNTANLRLSLNYDTEVTIDVYDLYGSPIKRLIDREAKQAGEYYLQDNTTNAPNGVYIYVVKACNQTKADIGIKE
jgi:hypothetical protein